MKSCNIDVVCAPTAAAPAIRLSTSMAKRTPSFSPIACASSIMFLATARVPGSVATISSVAFVSALKGLKHKLPHSFTHISSRIFLTGALRPALIIACDNARTRSVFSPDDSPRVNRLPSMCRTTPGSNISQAG